MSRCRERARSYVQQLAQLKETEKKQAFEAIKTGNLDLIKKLLEAYPGMVNQLSPESHGSPFIIAVLFELSQELLKADLGSTKVKNLISMIHIIINKQNLDVNLHDADGNTVFHRAIYYAVKAGSTGSLAKAKVFCGITEKLLAFISSNSQFYALLEKTNKHKETFLANLAQAEKYCTPDVKNYLFDRIRPIN